MKAAVVTFPGSNCDRDCYKVLKNVIGADVRFLWHKESKIGDIDLIMLPGGFSYGDYLRCGAIAKFSPIMDAVMNFAEKGGLVLGVCNGFQILTESQLLPGVLVMNKSLKFICKHVDIKVENNKTAFTTEYGKGDILSIPIAHGDGNFTIDDAGYNELVKNDQIVFRYCSSEGDVNDSTNPNGARDNIAGIVNKKGNVLGMMPHPERASEPILGSVDGYQLFKSIDNYFRRG